jgi:hypothetical protein
MKTSVLILSLIAAIAMCCTTPCLAQSSGTWQDTLKAMLEEGKAGSESPDGGGLAYTPSEGTVLEEAVTAAMTGEQGDRACEIMKMAVELEYNPYSVLKTIYSVGGDLEIDPLCTCATEAGVMKAVIASAATDAVTPLNEPVYDVDEISRSQCLSGLAYTAQDQPVKEQRRRRERREVSVSGF